MELQVKLELEEDYTSFRHDEIRRIVQNFNKEKDVKERRKGIEKKQ